MEHYRAIAVHQPWASLIALGYKDVENRTWETRHRGLLVIHASKEVDREAVRRHADILARHDHPERSQVGGLVGIATLVEMVRECPSPWFVGPVGWLLSAQRAIPFIPFKGRQGLFRVPAEILEEHIGPQREILSHAGRGGAA